VNAIPEAVSARRRLGNAASNPTLALKDVFRRARGVTAEKQCLSDAVLEHIEHAQLGLSTNTRENNASDKTSKKGLNGLLTKKESQEHNRQNINLA